MIKVETKATQKESGEWRLITKEDLPCVAAFRQDINDLRLVLEIDGIRAKVINKHDDEVYTSYADMHWINPDYEFEFTVKT